MVVVVVVVVIGVTGCKASSPPGQGCELRILEGCEWVRKWSSSSSAAMATAVGGR